MLMVDVDALRSGRQNVGGYALTNLKETIQNDLKLEQKVTLNIVNTLIWNMF